MPRTTIDRALEAADQAVLIESSAELREAAAGWFEPECIGIDTEFVRERTYRAQLGLVQIFDGATAWLLDPLAIEDCGPLIEVLESPQVLKVLHSGSEDLEVLLHSLGTLPAPLADTQVACAMLGQPLQLGYHHAVKWLFGLEIEKDQTRSNWCKRPLHPMQLRYAAMDVVLLPRMIQSLRPRLEAEGRWQWLAEDVERMRRVASTPVDPDSIYLRISGIGRLDEPALRAVKHLGRWREMVAQRKDRARGFVISDADLLQLARNRPKNGRQLRDTSEVHPRALAMYQDQLLEVIAQAADDQSPLERIEPLTPSQRRQLKEMRDIVASAASGLGIDSALIASRRELERLIRAISAGKEPPERFMGWRKNVVSDRLLAVLG
jgi:ribonuclease D